MYLCSMREAAYITGDCGVNVHERREGVIINHLSYFSDTNNAARKYIDDVALNCYNCWSLCKEYCWIFS